MFKNKQKYMLKRHDLGKIMLNKLLKGKLIVSDQSW